MRFINYDCVVGAQAFIALSLGKKNTIGHKLDTGGIACLVPKTNFIAYKRSILTEFFGNPGSN